MLTHPYILQSIAEQRRVARRARSARAYLAGFRQPAGAQEAAGRLADVVALTSPSAAVPANAARVA